MRKAIQGFAISVAFAICSYASSAKATLIYVSTFDRGVTTIDTTTQVTTRIGNTGNIILLDIAFSPGGTLFGVDIRNLYTIDVNTIDVATGLLATTLVGSLGVTNVNALGFDSAGVLYGAQGNTLFTINTSTGAASPVGTGAFSSAGDLDFFGNTLFLSSTVPPPSTLVSLDPATAAATLPTSPVGFRNVLGIATDSVSSTLFGVTQDGEVLNLNTATGGGTLLFDTQLTNVLGAAIIPIPGPLPILGAGMAIGWSRKLRQRIKRSLHGVIPATKA
jgi:hypothetical protein